MISIITSTYNEFRTGQLQQAISSVLHQTYQNWELIIVGDNAPDAYLIKLYLTKIGDSRIKFINLTKRAGIASPGTIPKIKAIDIAGGDLFCFLDADNMYFPDHLTRCARAFDDDPSLDLVYENTLVKITKKQIPSNKQIPNSKFQIPNHLNNLQFPISKFPSILAGRQILNSKFLSFKWKKPDWAPKRQKMLMTSNFLDMSEPVFTRKSYFDAGGLNPSHHASDWLLWKAMLTSGHGNFKHLDHLGLIYHTNNLAHHLQYFGLMMMQKIGLTYHSERLRWMQKSIKCRFVRKYA